MAARRRRPVSRQLAERKAERRAEERERSDNIKPFVYGGIALVLLVGGMFVIRAVTRAERPAKANEKPARPEVEMGEKNARARDVKTWVESLQQQSDFALANQTDIPTVARLLGVTNQQDAVLKALYEAEDLADMRTFEVTGTSMVDYDSAIGKSGKVRAFFAAPAEERKFYAMPKMTAEFAFKESAGRYLIQSWEITEAPIKRKLVKKNKVEKRIGGITEREIEINGEKRIVTEAEATSLPHMDGVPEDTQRKIDAAIADLGNMDYPVKANRAVDDLVEFGKPAVPRLLNALYETKLSDTGSKEELIKRVQTLRRVTQALELLTGNRFGFDVRMPDSDKEAKQSEMLRETAIKQWFAYWRTYAYRDDWNKNIDQDEEDLLKVDDGKSK